MTDLFEREVARLERGIATLKMHEWGGGEGAALAEALGRASGKSSWGEKGGPRLLCREVIGSVDFA